MSSIAFRLKTVFSQPGLMVSLLLVLLPWLLAAFSAVICPAYYRPLFFPPVEEDSKVIVGILLFVFTVNTSVCFLFAKSRSLVIRGLVIGVCTIPSTILLQVLPMFFAKYVGAHALLLIAE